MQKKQSIKIKKSWGVPPPRCHLYIYVFDHLKLLRTIPHYILSRISVDWCAQVILIPCVSIILSSLVFKSNCNLPKGYHYCYAGLDIIWLCSAAGCLHFVVHLFLLIYVPGRFFIMLWLPCFFISFPRGLPPLPPRTPQGVRI